MGLCKRYYGRRHFAPTNLAVVDDRPRKPAAPPPPGPPKFLVSDAPPPPPAAPARQATLFDRPS